jgi:hypothetical protein
VYTLATYNPAGSSGAFATTPVVDSGSLPAPGAGALVTTGGGNVVLTVAAPPTAPDQPLGAFSGVSAALPIIGGKHPPVDPGSYALGISAVGAPGNGTATVSSDRNGVVYTSGGTYTGPDSFTYTVTNSVGGWATGTVTVTVTAYGVGFNQISADLSGMTYAGIPGYSYALDYTADLTPQVVWTPLVTNVAAGNGVLIFTNTATGFYRTRWVP